MQRKKILVAIDWYLPGYKAGGPIRSCANIVNQLKEYFDFCVITSDTDFSDHQPYPNIKSNAWNVLEDGTRVYYFSKDKLDYSSIEKVILDEKPDVVYMNSFFSRPFTLTPLKVLRKNKLNAKSIIAPRGMLGQGALAIKPLKKLAFISFSKMMGTYNLVRWHASTDQEAKEIKAIFGNHANVHVALNLSSIRIATVETKNKNANQLNLVFFSRISRKKNLHLALEILAGVSSKYQINFGIYGTKEDDAYWQECEKLIKELPSHIKASYEGVVPSDRIPAVFKSYHFSILPTMHENYGHSIVESFACGVPVIISTNTPWQNLAQLKAGWEFDLSDQQKFLPAIEQAAAMGDEEFSLWQKGSVDLATKVLNNNDTVTQNKLLFER